MTQQLCNPTEVALKSFFLGPQSENAQWFQAELNRILQSWFQWRRGSFPQDGAAISGQDQALPEFQEQQQHLSRLVDELCRRFEDELPKFSPRYVGHMFSELSLPALLGHILTLLHNPNIISREAATVAADLEDEAIAALAAMLGMPNGIGHFTSGGTVANYEAVVRARTRMEAWLARGVEAGYPVWESAHLGWDEFDRLPDGPAPALPRPVLFVPRSAHYSWDKAARLIAHAELRYLEDLDAQLRACRDAAQPVLGVVSVVGTTEKGSVDSVHETQDVLDRWREQQGIHLWHHVDAAYGGFFCCLRGQSNPPLTPRVMRALDAIGRTTSVTLDPHKLGYVPYSSGTFVCAGRRDYTCVRTLAPYIDYDAAHDRGPYTLEGSRSAAGAVATWLTARSIGLDADGYGRLLARTIRQKQKLERWLTDQLPGVRVAAGCDTNLLCFCVADPGEPLSHTNARTLRILQRLAERKLYYVSKTQFVADDFVQSWNAQVDTPHVLMLRLCLMNPFFDSHELDVNHLENLVASIGHLAD